MIHSHQTTGVISEDHTPSHHTHKDCNLQENVVEVTARENSTSIVYTNCDCTMEPNVCYNKVGMRNNDAKYTLYECDTTANICYNMATGCNPAETQEGVKEL